MARYDATHDRGLGRGDFDGLVYKDPAAVSANRPRPAALPLPEGGRHARCAKGFFDAGEEPVRDGPLLHTR
ncbi:hypothetical protein GCM10017559_77460 [Streptosporangium longisporum]|uniref:ATP-dependent DNA ligase family profile domain-containing protein n=1 Tax=Streptosporangium longisporum TaxID=46187 RepID=A0ABP6LE52_9ACTN